MATLNPHFSQVNKYGAPKFNERVDIAEFLNIDKFYLDRLKGPCFMRKIQVDNVLT